jgi:hypothetical protein
MTARRRRDHIAPDFPLSLLMAVVARSMHVVVGAYACWYLVRRAAEGVRGPEEPGSEPGCGSTTDWRREES